MKKIHDKILFFIGPVLIALGVILKTTAKDSSGSLGIVFIAVGGLFFILSMVKKREQDNSSQK